MATLKEKQNEIDTLKIQKEIASQNVETVKSLFEASNRQTEKFWNLYKWVFSIFSAMAVAAIGIQLYQNLVRLDDAVTASRNSLSALEKNFQNRMNEIEARTDDRVSDAIKKISAADIKKVFVRNHKDGADTIIAWPSVTVNSVNSRPFQVVGEFTFRIRVAFEGSGITKLNGVNIVADQMLIKEILGSSPSADGDSLSIGKYIETNSGDLYPEMNYIVNFSITRGLRNCEDYEKIIRNLRGKPNFGRLTIEPFFKDSSASVTKHEFSVSLSSPSNDDISCQELWDRISP